MQPLLSNFRAHYRAAVSSLRQLFRPRPVHQTETDVHRKQLRLAACASQNKSASPIIRVWRGVTAERVAEPYFAYIRSCGIPAYRAVEGNLGVYVLRRVANGVAEFMVISLWDSVDAIQRFTRSEDVTDAVYFDQDRRFLMFQEPKVAHYELSVADDSMTGTECEVNPFDGTA